MNVAFAATLDWIFVDGRRLQVDSILPSFTEEVMSKEVAIPSSIFPSDHTALVADISFK